MPNKQQVYELVKIGLTEGEAKVYLSLTELGSSTAGSLVKTAAVAHSNIYLILDRLMKKGIVSYTIKSKTKYFQAVSPDNLLGYLEKKEIELQDQKVLLKAVLPQLKELQIAQQQQEAEVFIGTNGLRAAYEKLFAGAGKKDETAHFYTHKQEYAKQSDLFYFSIFDILKKVSARGIANEKYKESEVTKKATFVKYRFVDFPLPGNMELCKDKVLIISWEKPIVGILIHSESIAKSLKEYFEVVWKLAKNTR